MYQNILNIFFSKKNQKGILGFLLPTIFVKKIYYINNYLFYKKKKEKLKIKIKKLKKN